MLNLKNEGLFIANGNKLSVLVRVVGKAPLLDIVSGVLLNEMLSTGKVIALDNTSPEIQDILENPDSYIFLEPSITDAVTNNFGLDKGTEPRVEYSKDTWKDWTEKYNMYKRIYENGIAFAKMVRYLSMEYNQSVANSKMIIRLIEKDAKNGKIPE